MHGLKYHLVALSVENVGLGGQEVLLEIKDHLRLEMVA